MVHIENEGAIFRGFSRGHPTEVYSHKSGWQPYRGEIPKPIEWGNVIPQEEAERRIGQKAGAPPT